MGQAEEAREVRVGGKQLVLIKGIERLNNESNIKAVKMSGTGPAPIPRLMHQLILRGATEGVVRQYYTALKRIFRMLATWGNIDGDSSDKDLLLCAGGGASHLSMYFIMKDLEAFIFPGHAEGLQKSSKSTMTMGGFNVSTNVLETSMKKV